MARRDYTKVVIRYFAIPNTNKARGGFLPMIEEDGRMHGDTYSGLTYSRDDAELMAKVRALELATKFTGDYQVTVRGADARYAAAALARDERHWQKKRSSTR